MTRSISSFFSSGLRITRYGGSRSCWIRWEIWKIVLIFDSILHIDRHLQHEFQINSRWVSWRRCDLQSWLVGVIAPQKNASTSNQHNVLRWLFSGFVAASPPRNTSRLNLGFTDKSRQQYDCWELYKYNKLRNELVRTKYDDQDDSQSALPWQWKFISVADRTEW